MFGIGETELVIIVVFAFLLFGPDKLPGMGRTLGRVLRQFREASDGFTEVVQTNIMDPAAEELEKSPKQRKREAAEALDADVDVPAEDGEAADETPRRETFAERKARLAAERKAAEEAEAEEAEVEEASTASAEAGAEDLSDDGAAAGTDDDAAADDAAGQKDPQEGVPTSAADLYALGARKSSRTRAAEQAAAEAAEATEQAQAAEPVELAEQVAKLAEQEAAEQVAKPAEQATEAAEQEPAELAEPADVADDIAGEEGGDE